MRQRGRKSEIGLALVAGSFQGQRPPAPERLNDEEREEWNAIVNRMPPDWFTRETWSMLKSLCAQVCIQRQLEAASRLLKPEELATAEGMKAFRDLMAMQEKVLKTIVSPATKMRLTPQSRYDTLKANTAVNNTVQMRPWEIKLGKKKEGD